MIWKELTTGIYPWEIPDEGMENLLYNLQHEAANNAAYLIASMHYQTRPLFDNVFPHNPVRKRYKTEDSRVYFTVHPEMYKNSRIKPLRTERDFLKGTDWMEVFATALRKSGIKPGAEISHTPLDTERALKEFPDCIQKDIYGKSPGSGFKTNQQLCWNSPDARAYVAAMASDLAANYDIDMIQTCTLLFNAGKRNIHPLLGVTLGGCFCENCEREAKKAGLDWEGIKRVVHFWADVMNKKDLDSSEEWILLQQGDSTSTMLLLEYPELYEWLRFRCNSVTRYFKEVSEAVHAVNPKIDFRYNTCWTDAELIGQNLRDISKYVDSVRIMDYAEQEGDEKLLAGKSKWLANVRRQVGEDFPIIGGIAPRAKATPDLIKKGIKLVAKGGADGLSYGFYDGASIENLRAIKQGMAEAEVYLR